MSYTINQNNKNNPIPDNITKLKIENVPLENIKFPSSITELSIQGVPLENIKLPSSITKLIIILSLNDILNNLDVISTDILKFFNSLDNSKKLPDKLNYIEIGYNTLGFNNEWRSFTNYLCPFIIKTNISVKENKDAMEQLKITIDQLKQTNELQNKQLNKIKEENASTVNQLIKINQLQNEQINDLKKEVEILMDTVKEYHKKS